LALSLTDTLESHSQPQSGSVCLLSLRICQSRESSLSQIGCRKSQQNIRCFLETTELVTAVAAASRKRRDYTKPEWTVCTSLYTVSQKCTNFETVRINFDKI